MIVVVWLLDVEDELRLLLPQISAGKSVPVSEVKKLQAGYQLLAFGFDNTAEIVMKRLAPDSVVQKNLTELIAVFARGPKICSLIR